MAKIKPVISNVRKRNIFDYFDPLLNTQIKVCGFDIDIYDNISQKRVRKRIKADYKTVIIYITNLENKINSPDSVNIYENSVPHLNLSSLLNGFLKEKGQESDRVGKGLTKNSLRRYETAVNSMYKFFNCDIQLSKLNEGQIENWIKDRKENKLSVNTINSYLKHYKSLFNWGVRKGIINSNPFLTIAPFKNVPKLIRVLTEDEMSKLWNICTPRTRWHPYIVVYLLTGARISEILKPKLKWEDIDFENNTLKLMKRKRGKQTTFPLTPTLKNVLIKVKEEKRVKKSFKSIDDVEYVFPYSVSYISRKLKKDVFIPAGLPDVTVHDLRRSFASHLSNLGFEIYDVSQIMAHSKTEVTQNHYLSQIPSKSRKMILKLEEYFQNS